MRWTNQKDEVKQYDAEEANEKVKMGCFARLGLVVLLVGIVWGVIMAVDVIKGLMS